MCDLFVHRSVTGKWYVEYIWYMKHVNKWWLSVSSLQELKHENIVALLDFQVCKNPLTNGLLIMSGASSLLCVKASVYIHDYHTFYCPSSLVSQRSQTRADGSLSVPHDPLLSNAAWTLLFSVDAANEALLHLFVLKTFHFILLRHIFLCSSM